MSVLIKGMEMPKSCHECPLLYVTSICDGSKDCPLQPIVRCENCEHFDLDHFENFRGIPLIVAHEICNRWGNGCKTDSNGFCFMGERRENGHD